MKQAFRLIFYPRKQVLLRQGMSIVIMYAILMPYMMRLLSLEEPMRIAREAFRYCQLLLALATLWPVFHFFLPVYQPRVREALQALHHPVASCAIGLAAVQQILCIPVYCWIYIHLTGYRMIILILMFQSLWIGLAYACLLYLFRSPIGIAAGSLVYLCISTPLAESRFPLLLRPGRLLDGFQTNYWIIQGTCFTVMLGFLLWHVCGHRGKSFL